MVSSRHALDRRYAEQAVKAQQPVPDGNWITATMTGGDGSIPDRLRREVAPDGQDRVGAGPEPGADPMKILRQLQVRQVQDIITAPLPGPEGWTDLELPLPACPGDGHTHLLKTGAPTPGHAAAEGAVCADDPDETDLAERRRLGIQHEADPYPAEAPEVARADLGKVHGGLYTFPPDYPVPDQVDVTDFQRPPLAAGHQVLSPGYEPARTAPQAPPVTPEPFRRGPGGQADARPLLSWGCPDVGMSSMPGSG